MERGAGDAGGWGGEWEMRARMGAFRCPGEQRKVANDLSVCVPAIAYSENFDPPLFQRK